MSTTLTDPREDATVTELAHAGSDYVLVADGLHRVMGDATVVHDLSLHLRKGDVLGLLGLNGAGKSTTLKMLCGMLVPDAGSVRINQYCMIEEPLKARSHIGFLPDQPPLYNDMRVHEFLKLCGQLHGLRGPRLRESVLHTIDQCSLGNVQRKLIGTLSKGYRQRVGLAQAIVHQPDVLLLDEPSNGLDPQQLDAMRTLIRDYASGHAIVFSTHLLAEAQATCNRVAVIHEGQLVADDTASGSNLESLFHGAIA